MKSITDFAVEQELAVDDSSRAQMTRMLPEVHVTVALRHTFDASSMNCLLEVPEAMRFRATQSNGDIVAPSEHHLICAKVIRFNGGIEAPRRMMCSG